MVYWVDSSCAVSQGLTFSVKSAHGRDSANYLIKLCAVRSETYYLLVIN